MTNIQTWISQLVKVGMTLSHFSVKVWMPASDHLRRISSLKIFTFRVCTDQLSRNLTNILWLLETFCRIIFLFGTKLTYVINERLLMPRKHLNISATLYLVDSALCNVRCDTMQYFYLTHFFYFLRKTRLRQLKPNFRVLAHTSFSDLMRSYKE